MNFYVNIVADEAKEQDVAGIIMDGGSTFLKWCEHAMTDVLLRRGVIKEEGDSFNQKEWRTRNQLNRDVLTRLHGLPVPCVINTFHLKDVSNYVDNGSGGKVLMKIGERPDWDKGTMRLFSQQIFLSRYMKKPMPPLASRPTLPSRTPTIGLSRERLKKSRASTWNMSVRRTPSFLLSRAM